MRNIILFLLLSITLNISAIDFMGVSIDDKLSDAHITLINKGFNIDSVLTLSDTKNIIYIGEFIGEECEVTLHHDNDKISEIHVSLPIRQHWITLKEEYFTFKQIFENKWGNPTKEYMIFPKPFHDGDGYEMMNVNLGRCGFISFWRDKETNHRIILKISDAANVYVMYTK